ncbi:MAG: precorrin-2 C(20)-methyltransferase, partial [Oscillospiraceae bacterium]
DKPLVKLSLPMLSDRAAWDAYHDAAAAELISILRSGRSVAFLTLGDPSIYSTYLYLHRRVRAAGLDAQMIPGVPSFCAAAAAMGEGLAEGGVPLHIVPASYEGLDEALGWRGVKVLMKTGHFFPAVRESLRHAGVLDKTTLITRCGMSGEQVTDALDSVEHAGYFSLFVVRE